MCLCRQQSVEHPERRHETARLESVAEPAQSHIEQFGVVPTQIRLDLSHADVWSEVVEFPCYSFSGQFRDTWQHAHRSQFLLPIAPAQGHVP